MDYLEMAAELVRIQARFLQIPAKQALSKMSKREMYVLYHLAYFHDNVHPKELSESMAVSTARIACLLNKLEEKKQIQRLPDHRDNRQVIVALTDLGRRRIERDLADVLPKIGALLEKLGPDDAAAYIRIQNKILSNFWSDQTEE